MSILPHSRLPFFSLITKDIVPTGIKGQITRYTQGLKEINSFTWNGENTGPVYFTNHRKLIIQKNVYYNRGFEETPST